MSAAAVENPNSEENGFTVDVGSRLAMFEQQDQGDYGRPPIGRAKNRGFKMFQAPSEKCTTCDKRVYEMEKITADDKVYHKSCFRCAKCNRTLGLGNYAALEGQTFCKPHFIELFKKKGNYEEGFGKERHKNKWLTPTGSRETTPRPEDDEYDGGLVHASRIEITNGRYDSNGHTADDDEMEVPRRDDAQSKRESFHFKNMSSVKSMWESGEVHPREDDIPEYRRDLQDQVPAGQRGNLRARYEMAVKESEVAPVRKVAPAKSVPDLRDSPDRELSLPSSREGSVSKDDMDDRPKPGKMKSLLAKFKSMENVTKDKPLAPPKPRNITPPREASPKPNRYPSVSRSDSEREDKPPAETRDVIKSEDHYDDGIPHTTSVAKNIAAKFQQIEHDHETAQARDRVQSTSSYRSRKSSTAEEEVFHATPVVSQVEPVEQARYSRDDDILSPRSQYSEQHEEDYREEGEEEVHEQPSYSNHSAEQEYMNYSNEYSHEQADDEYQGSYEDQREYSNQQESDEYPSYSREYAENDYHDGYTQEQIDDMAYYNSNNNNSNAYYSQYYSPYAPYPEQYDNYNLDYAPNSHFYAGYYDEISGKYGYYNPETQQFLPYDQCEQYTGQYEGRYGQNDDQQIAPDQTVYHEQQVLPASEKSEVDDCVSMATVQLSTQRQSQQLPVVEQHRKLEVETVERPPEKPARSSSRSVLSRYKRNISNDSMMSDQPPAFGSYFGQPKK